MDFTLHKCTESAQKIMYKMTTSNQLFSPIFDYQPIKTIDNSCAFLSEHVFITNKTTAMQSIYKNIQNFGLYNTISQNPLKNA